MDIKMGGYWNNNKEDFKKIAEFQNNCLKTRDDEIIISFQECKFISPNILTVLGGLKENVELNGKKVRFDFSSIDNPYLMTYLYKSRFMEYLNPEEHINYSGQNFIQYKKFDILDDNYDELVTDYTQQILKLMPIRMSEELEAEITSKIYEVFINAQEHSGSSIGVHACGHYFPKKKELHIGIYDGGIGIVDKIRNLTNSNKESNEILKWAFTSGKSTVTNIDYKRGLGLDLLKQLVEINEGKMFAYTNDAAVTISSDFEYYEGIAPKIIGTSINIIIKEDKLNIYEIRRGDSFEKY